VGKKPPSGEKIHQVVKNPPSGEKSHQVVKNSTKTMSMNNFGVSSILIYFEGNRVVSVV
jgi:hypothetical protein